MNFSGAFNETRKMNMRMILHGGVRLFDNLT